jgi:hypothetical protein
MQTKEILKMFGNETLLVSSTDVRTLGIDKSVYIALHRTLNTAWLPKTASRTCIKRAAKIISNQLTCYKIKINP